MMPKASPSPIAKESTKTSLAFRSRTTAVSDLKPNHTRAHSLIKKTGKKARNRGASAAARPGIVGTRPTKNTYFAQNSEVPGKPIVTRMPNIDIIHNRGADKATPPM